MIAATIQLDQSTLDAIALLARQQGKSSEQVMREAICKYADQGRRVLPKGMGQYHSGVGDIGVRAEEILAAEILADADEETRVTVVVDTGAIFAVYDADDHNHSAVRRVMEQVPGPYVLPPLILAEVDYLLLKRLGQQAELQFLEDVASGAFQLDPLTDLDIVRCREIILQYEALELGAADASIVAAAERHDTLQLLTLDQRDFRAITSRSGQPFLLLPYDAP